MNQQQEIAAPVAAYGGVELLGVSHRTAPLDVLERLALSDSEIQEFYERMYATEGVSDVIVLSTCNRTEIYATLDTERLPQSPIYPTLVQIAGSERLPDEKHIYRSHGRDSVEHLFRVACGLDSMVLGEQQILGQVKSAYDASRQFRGLTAYFEKVVQSAFKVAKRSRNDTDIGRGAVSIASAGVHLATRIYGDFSKRRIAVVGAGETGRLVAEHFRKLEPRGLTILNRSLARAEKLAEDVEGAARPLEDLLEVLADSDVVATAIGIDEPIVTVDLVSRAMAQRSGRSLAIIDLGLPRNVDVAVQKIRNVFVHDIEALRQVVDANLSHRRQEIPVVEDLVQEQLDKLISWQKSSEVGPLISALRQAIECMRQEEIDKISRDLDPKERKAVDRATRAVVNKIMHGPMRAIKEFAREQDRSAERLELVRQVFNNFDLDED